ncbi:MAG: AAA family ATPase [Syntrophaceae bacterium]|nr:AAA family ATPase [Syntrophaceae bacterium]
MATMIPADVESFTTEGEKQSYRFLEEVAKPDARYLCWYLPDIMGREPDFILFSKKVGLIVLEVKDWNLSQIREANPRFFVIAKGSKTEQHQNPYKQSREYLVQLIETIKRDRRLVSKDPPHLGKSKIPINCGVIFPNINKHEYIQKGFDQVIEKENIFFWDDLHPASPIYCDTTGNCFAKTVEGMFPPKFSFNLTGSELDHLKQLIFPTVKIELPERKANFAYDKRISRLESLDNHQEALARKFDGGHRIIIGPSGSGKSLILVHKAACLLRYNSKIKSILFVCYNITLVNYIRRLLGEKGVPFGIGGVQVKHFFELCAEIIGEPIEYENQDSDYYDLVVQEALEKVNASRMQFDAVLIDEGQDFSDTMFKVLTEMLNPATDNLTVALDENQNLYQKRSSWKDLGVKARGRVHCIDYVYRNTIEISDFADRFIGHLENGGGADSRQMSLFPDFFDFHGPHPVFRQFLGMDAIITYTTDEVVRVAMAEGCPYSEIAVLYVMQQPEADEAPLPDRLEDALAARGIMSKWASENYRSKRTYDITTNSVTISTIHSAKGMDFSCVFLLGLDYLEPKRWTDEQIHKLVYVALTRARYQLYIPFINETSLINRLHRCIRQD